MKIYKNLSLAIKERQDVKIIKLTLKTATFPKELFELTELEEAYLDGLVEHFPGPQGHWPKLKILSIKWSQFQGDLAGVFSLPKLANLKIIETPLHQLLLPLGATQAPLKSLTIKGCGLKELPEEISMCSELEELSLPGNQLEALPFAFRELTKLKRLNLDNNHLTHFPDEIKTMQHLGHLSIDGNKFSAQEKARIQREFHLTFN
jgi:leucine-rich repeat protein SHOC2